MSGDDGKRGECQQRKSQQREGEREVSTGKGLNKEKLFTIVCTYIRKHDVIYVIIFKLPNLFIHILCILIYIRKTILRKTIDYDVYIQ